MKKLLALFLAVLFVVGVAPLALADDVIELNMYFPVSVGGGPDQLISALCDEFHGEHPEIKINPIYAGSYADTTTKVMADIKAGNTPAIALMFSIDLYQLYSLNVLQDYNQFCTTEEDMAWLNGFYDGFMENSRLPDGNGGYLTYGIPWQRSTIILYWNKEAFKEVGLDPEVAPKTWDELEDYATKLVKKDANGNVVRYGIEVPSDKAGYAYWMLQTFTLTQDHFNLMSDDGTEVYFNDPKTITGLKFWKHLSDIGAMPVAPKWANTRNDFVNGTIAMMYHTTGQLTSVKKDAQFEFGTSYLPMNTTYGSPTGGGNFYLFKGDNITPEMTQAAFTFIQWMTNNPDRVAQWSIDTGYVATRPEAYETQRMIDYAAGFPSALTARDQLEYASAEFSVYDQKTVQDILDTAIEEVMTGLKDAETALNEAQAAADAILEDYR